MSPARSEKVSGIPSRGLFNRQPDGKVGGLKDGVVGGLSQNLCPESYVAFEKRWQDGRISILVAPEKTGVVTVWDNLLGVLSPGLCPEVGIDAVKVERRVSQVATGASHQVTDLFLHEDPGQGGPEKGNDASASVVGMNGRSSEFGRMFKKGREGTDIELGGGIESPRPLGSPMVEDPVRPDANLPGAVGDDQVACKSIESVLLGDHKMLRGLGRRKSKGQSPESLGPEKILFIPGLGDPERRRAKGGKNRSHGDLPGQGGWGIIDPENSPAI
jgi:hypothetical protein